MGGKAPAAPAPVDAAKSSGEYLFGKDFGSYQGVTDPALQAKLLEAERVNRPQYAALDLADINTYMLGTGGQQGVIGLTEQATRKSAELDREAQAMQREQDIASLSKYGAQTTEALRAADPYSKAIAEAQQAYALDAFNKAGQLGFEDQRAANQQALMLGQQAGRTGSNSVIAAQMLNRQNALAQRAQMAQMAGQQAFGYNRAMSGDIANVILGRPSNALAMGSQFMGQSQGMAQNQGPKLFDPNAGVNLALQNNANQANYQASVYGAKQAKQGAIIGGGLGAVGALGGGLAGGIGAAGGASSFFCWVAREVYGVDSPSWLLFREWLTLKAPMWFFDLYMSHGEKFAAYISDKPKLKKLIKWWMDGRIANYLKN